MDKLIITVAPIGSIPTKAMTPYVPVTPAEVIQDACDCCNAGASVVHIHARDKDQKPSHDYDFFSETVAGIRSRSDLIIQISTGGRASQAQETRGRALAIEGVEMASLNTGSVNFPSSAYVNEPALIDHLARVMLDRGIKPEIECFDFSFISNGLDLLKKGLLKPPLHFNFVMGLKGALPYSLANYAHMMRTIPEGSTWNVSGIGPAQLPLALASMISGGHVRVGLEDNIYYSKGVLATNVQMVERIVRLAREQGREVATPAEARAILQLP